MLCYRIVFLLSAVLAVCFNVVQGGAGKLAVFSPDFSQWPENEQIDPEIHTLTVSINKLGSFVNKHTSMSSS